MSTIVSSIRQELKQNSNEKTKQSGLSFFKEDVKLYGVKTPAAVKIGKERFKTIKDKEKTELFDLCEELWKSGYLEEAVIASNWSYCVNKHFKPTDFGIFEKWVDTYIGNWAACDTFCNHTMGAFVTMYPQYLANLKKWALSKNRWMRRASAVSLIIPAKQGKFLNDVFEISNILLLDPDDMVQKGYGWMLKVAASKHEKEVFDYVMTKKSVMPRTALRYAIEKMPIELKKKAMEK